MDVKKMTNDEFIHYLMNFSPFGALAQIFVIESIRYYSEQVLSAGEPADDGDGFVSKITWYKLSKDVQQRLGEKYEPPKEGNAEN